MSPRITPCPTCKREVTWGEASPFRPFCSDRCRLIDLGAWFSESRAIPAQEPHELDQGAGGSGTDDELPSG